MRIDVYILSMLDYHCILTLQRHVCIFDCFGMTLLFSCLKHLVVVFFFTE